MYYSHISLPMTATMATDYGIRMMQPPLDLDLEIQHFSNIVINTATQELDLDRKSKRIDVGDGNVNCITENVTNKVCQGSSQFLGIELRNEVSIEMSYHSHSNKAAPKTVKSKLAEASTAIQQSIYIKSKKLRSSISRFTKSATHDDARQTKKNALRDDLEEAQVQIRSLLCQLGSGLHWWGSFL